MRKEFAAALAKAVNSHSLSRGEVTTLLTAENEEAQALFLAADQVRTVFLGNAVHLRAIIEFSNYCVKNCFYCGLRRDNRSLIRYRMTPEEILTAARQASREGYKTIVLQAGEDPYYKTPVLTELVRQLKTGLGVAVTLSLGDLTRETYRKLRLSGADRYLLKHETADPVLFNRLRPGTSLGDRLRKLLWLKELGYQVGSGNIVGLPGQTVAALVDDILLLKELNVEMAGIGPFLPHPEIPLASCPPGSLELTLKVLAVTRLLLPLAHLPATTAVATLHPEGHQRALQAGANVVMPDLTPPPYWQHYDIYPGRNRPPGEGKNSFSWWVKEMKSLERKVGQGYGHSLGYPSQNF